MRRVGQARRRDTNEAAIVDALRHCGVQVFRVSGHGVPDLLTYAAGTWLPMEVKTPGGRLTPAQRVRRLTAPFPVVTTVAEALEAFGLPTPRKR